MYRKYRSEEFKEFKLDPQRGFEDIYFNDTDEDNFIIESDGLEEDESGGSRRKWLSYLNPFTDKDGKRLKRGKLIRRIITLLCLLGLVVLIIISVYNSQVRSQYKEIASTIDSRLDKYEYDFDTVKKVANILGVHDSESYNSVLQSIDMSDSVRRKYFSNDTFEGTPTATPTVEVIDIQYQYTPNTEERYYLMTVNVDYGTGSFKTYYMTCGFLGTTLTSLEIY